MTWEWIGFFLVSLAALGVAFAVRDRLPADLRNLVVLGVAFRIVGSIARHEVLFRVYRGVGDATGYYGHGRYYAQALAQLDFTIFDPSGWHAGQWWGTQFVRYVSGAVLLVIGPTLRGEFLVFSLFGFAGLCFFGLAFARAYPQISPRRYLAWLWLWPSLWFWPSSVGKDALLLLAFGLVTAGWVGRRGRISWLTLALGLTVATAIRPHMAALLALMVATAQVVRQRRGQSVIRAWVQGVLIGAGAVFFVTLALSQLGLSEADLEGVQEFAQYRGQLTQQGGSSIEGPAGGVAAVPTALVNVLLRPFPWEAHNVPALLASLEIIVLWVIILRRRQVWGVLRHFRSDRLLSLALPLAGAYSLLIGLVFANLGIISRQRVVIFPFLLLLLEAYPPGYVRALWQRHHEALAARAAALARRPAARRATP